MRFVQLSVDDPHCVGAVLAHTTARLAKGTLLTAARLNTIKQAGITWLTVALLDDGDLTEDDAATRLAACLAAHCPNIVAHRATTGRVNLFAHKAGVLALDRDAIHAFNTIDPSITVATLAAFARVDAGQMVATIKIIPFAVPERLVAAAEATVTSKTMRVAAFCNGLHCLLVQTVLPAIKTSVLDKTAALTTGRLASIGCELSDEQRCDHQTAALADVLQDHARNVDLVVVFGASAVSDPDDVIPAAIRAAGGTVQRVGMPVDPGNLLVVGHLGKTTIIGAPGCARSPKRNGFDWVIERWAADLPIDDEAISTMGVGGLLAEIEDRPRPRAKR